MSDQVKMQKNFFYPTLKLQQNNVDCLSLTSIFIFSTKSETYQSRVPSNVPFYSPTHNSYKARLKRLARN